jgi:ABC-type amino acid transport system permease subunit
MITSDKQSRIPQISFDWNGFVQEHITRSWLLVVWLVVLTYVTVQIVLSQLQAYPVSTIISLIVWAVTVAITVFAEAVHRHVAVTLWLKNNLYSSITNILFTLIIWLGLVAVLYGLFHYAVTTASFVRIPATDIRAELVEVTAVQYCFNVGAQDETGLLTNPNRECYPASTFDPELSQDELTAVTLGTDPVNICFDTMPNDPENGVACFVSSANNPGLFTVSYTFSGANWGAVIANLTNLMVFRFNRAEIWRVWAAGIFGVILAVASFIVYRDGFKRKKVRQALTYIWLASPIIFYILLNGVPAISPQQFAESIIPYLGILLITGLLWFANKTVNAKYPPQIGESEAIRLVRLLLTIATGIFAFLAFLSIISIILLIFGLLNVDGDPLFVRVNPDFDWGGFLLTLIITAFAIVVSFPLGILLALGRRSTITGIPNWLTYPAAFIIMIYGLFNSTPQLIADARNNFELALAYWPLVLPLIAYIFQRVWKGNVVSGFCTLYIEFIRGIPLITVLFLTIILFPIFLPPDMEILGTWRVMWGFTLFSAAYLAENVRGGLQAIPKGQYEAADSLGLSAYNKYRLIILPQALRIVIPAITNQYIGLFKDTTLVAIVGLLDILGVANAIAAQPQWLGVRREAYVYIALLYFVISAIMAGYSARLERQAGLGER